MKFKSGGSLGELYKSMGGASGLATTGVNFAANLIPTNDNLSMVKGNNVQQGVRSMTSNVAGAFGPVGAAVGAGINLMGKAADSMKNVVCDEVTGECVENTNGVKGVLSKALDPIGNVTGAVQNVFKGNFKGALDNVTSGVFNFDKSDDKRAQELKAQVALRQQTQANQLSNQNKAMNESRRLATLSNQYSFGNFKKGGKIGCGCTKQRDGIDTDILYKLSNGGKIKLNKLVGNSDIFQDFNDQTKYKLKSLAALKNISLRDYLFRDSTLKKEIQEYENY